MKPRPQRDQPKNQPAPEGLGLAEAALALDPLDLQALMAARLATGESPTDTAMALLEEYGLDGQAACAYLVAAGLPLADAIVGVCGALPEGDDDNFWCEAQGFLQKELGKLGFEYFDLRGDWLECCRVAPLGSAAPAGDLPAQREQVLQVEEGNPLIWHVCVDVPYPRVDDGKRRIVDNPEPMSLGEALAWLERDRLSASLS
jgi:hypothetical protein